MRLAMITATLALVSGCSILPDSIRSEVEHISHPMAGWPVSANDTEDGLSQVNVIGHWQKGRIYVENGIGYNLQGRNGGGFFGPEVTYTGRIGVELWSRK